jgi:hypothetical protein
VSVVPSSVYDVPPATPVPFAILVGNTPNKGFTLSVNDIAGGNGVVGTFVATGAAAATYTAPVSDTSSTYTLEARSSDDPRRFGQALVSVRGGFALPAADNRDQWVPEWDPTGPRMAFVRGGPAWELVVYDFETQTERVLTPITWSGTTYDGRVAWSDDGSRILFSQETSGRRSIGLIQANGTGRITFQPQGSIDYEDACFLPLATDSIYVTQHQGLSWSLRAYPLPSGPLTTGRVLYSPTSTVELHSPDATLLEGNRRPQLVFETVVDGDGTVRSMSDDNAGRIGVVYSSATARTEEPRWAFPIGGQEWITFAHHQNDALYRVSINGLDLPFLCYHDSFAEASGDLKAMVGGPFAFQNAHAVTRRDATGHWRIWIVDFPPPPPIVIGRANGGRRGVSRAVR